MTLGIRHQNKQVTALKAQPKPQREPVIEEIDVGLLYYQWFHSHRGSTGCRLCVGVRLRLGGYSCCIGGAVREGIGPNRRDVPFQDLLGDHG